MIAKEHLAPASHDKFQRAGDEAERQMAFYLRRAFADDPAVHVFHNLRLDAGDDAAQIDHLILHRSGAVVIESKSVTSAVRINERDEWTRQWNGRWTGMPSPVLQAKRQAEFMRKTLQGRREELMGKAIFGLVQKGFRAFVIDVVVAISDGGVIQYRGQLPEVRKADQVVDRLRELLQEQASLAHPMSKDPRSKNWGITFKPDEFVRINAFLRSAHRERGHPLPETPISPDRQVQGGQTPVGRHSAGPEQSGPVYVAVGPVTAVKAPTTDVYICQKCSSTRLGVEYGRYGYYFKCRDCEGNTRINLKCPSCAGQVRTRKNQRQFFADCSSCNSSRLYFTNSA